MPLADRLRPHSGSIEDQLTVQHIEHEYGTAAFQHATGAGKRRLLYTYTWLHDSAALKKKRVVYCEVPNDNVQLLLTIKLPKYLYDDAASTTTSRVFALLYRCGAGGKAQPLRRLRMMKVFLCYSYVEALLLTQHCNVESVNAKHVRSHPSGPGARGVVGRFIISVGPSFDRRAAQKPTLSPRDICRSSSSHRLPR